MSSYHLNPSIKSIHYWRKTQPNQVLELHLIDLIWLIATVPSPTIKRSSILPTKLLGKYNFYFPISMLNWSLSTFSPLLILSSILSISIISRQPLPVSTNTGSWLHTSLLAKSRVCGWSVISAGRDQCQRKLFTLCHSITVDDFATKHTSWVVHCVAIDDLAIHFTPWKRSGKSGGNERGAKSDRESHDLFC